MPNSDLIAQSLEEWNSPTVINRLSALRPARPVCPCYSRNSFLLLLLCLLLSSLSPAFAGAASQLQPGEAIAYRLSCSEARSQRFHVSITLPHPGTGKIAFAIPAWTPGYYQILHYERNIENLHAEDETGRVLPVTHSSLRVWEIPPRPQSTDRLTLSYDVRASERGFGFFDCVMNSRQHQGYINGASAFLYVVGGTQLPVTLSVTLPAGWKMATPLDSSQDRAGIGVVNAPDASPIFQFQAKDYDEFIDCPLQMGQFDSLAFNVNEIPFQCILVGDHQANRARLTEMLTRITRSAMQSMTGIPFKRYFFIYHIGDIGFLGGLEHRSSTVIHLDAPIKNADDDDLVTTTAHEFVHAWNVKQIHPVNLGPFDYTQPVRTASLWWAEGVTDYYADLIPVRAGLRTDEWFLKQQAEKIAFLDNNPAHSRVTLEEASLKAWEGQSEGFGGLSYYLKGGLMGLYFDLKIRELTGNSHTLEDVFKDLDSRYAQRGIGYPEEALLAALNRASNADLTEDYRRYIRGLDEIAWEEVLSRAGLELKRDARAYLGFSFLPETNPEIDTNSDADYSDRIVIIQKVEGGFPAARMGLLPGDRLFRVNGQEVNYGFAGPVLNTLPAAAPVALDIERNGKPMTLKGVAGVQYSHHALKPLPDSLQTELSRQIRKTLLSNADLPR